MMFQDILLYVAQSRKNLTGKEICSIIFQDRLCHVEHPEWSVNIPPKTMKKKKRQAELKKRLKVLHITDIHFDPKYSIGSSANCEKYLCCQNDDEVPSTIEDQAGFWGDYRFCDVPRHLLLDTFDYIEEEFV